MKIKAALEPNIPESRETHLLLAVLERAIRDYFHLKNVVVDNPLTEKLSTEFEFERTVSWLGSTEMYFGSFEYICELVGFNSDTLRQKIFQYQIPDDGFSMKSFTKRGISRALKNS